MTLKVPARVVANCRTPQSAAWLDRLPATLASVEEPWSLTVHTPFDNEEVSCAWVAPVVLADGTSTVLKLSLPHMEGEHEVQGLRLFSTTLAHDKELANLCRRGVGVMRPFETVLSDVFCFFFSFAASLRPEGVCDRLQHLILKYLMESQEYGALR